MFFKRKKENVSLYDKENYVPILMSSICTGETVAGFRHIKNKSFVEIMLIQSPKDLEIFMKRYGLTEVPKREY